MLLPFGKTNALEGQVDEFLNLIVKGALGLKQGIRAYLKEDLEEFSTWIEKIGELEHDADDLRKATEVALYTNSLIPESRGDVLGLLENMDDLIDKAKEVMQRIDVERPRIPAELRDGFLEIIECSLQAIESVVAAARAYFREPTGVRDAINKVDFYESEADRLSLKLKRRIFDTELGLSHKMHLRYFADQIESMTDIAEHVAERIAISTIKRSL